MKSAALQTTRAPGATAAEPAVDGGQLARFVTDRGASEIRLDVTRCMLDARRTAGKGFAAQTREIISLGRGIGRLTPRDYYYYRLYDDSLYSAEDKRRFLSERIHWPLTLKCSDVRWWATADDKIIAQTILERAQAPVPRVQGVYATGARNFVPYFTCRSTDELIHFFREVAEFPLFAKPIRGIGSFGAFSIDGFDWSSETLHLAGQNAVPLDDFIRQIQHGDGYLFQSRLLPHPRLEAVCGAALSTVRVIVIVEDGRPEIIEAAWKIPAAGNIADNFWRQGNLLADIDRDSGEVRRAIRGYGPQIEELVDHPESGLPLKGMTLPHWDAVKRACLDYALVFDKLRYQSWDVAVCAEGPVMIEVNAGSAFNLPQLAGGRGMLTERFKAFLDHCGY